MIATADTAGDVAGTRQPEPVAALLIGHMQPYLGVEGRYSLGAGAVLGTGLGGGPGSLASLAVLKAGEQSAGWALKDPARVPPLDYRYLDGVRDHRPLPTGAEDGEGVLETFAYFDAVIKTHETPAAVFRMTMKIVV